MLEMTVSEARDFFKDIPAIAHEAVSLALAAIVKHSVRQVVVPVKLIEGTTLGPAPRD